MLRLTRIEIDGFGPFADPQVIDFPKQRGVVVVYGENMRGKTTLLNAIRYAFFGRAVGRGSRPRKLHSLSNRERSAHGQYGFSVSLSFEFDNEAYDLVRESLPIVEDPTQDSDYRQDVMLRRGSQVLGPQERERLLTQVFPDEISRFFLFDGELLQEYEELILGESEAGQKISQAIERILGVPVLKAGRAHLATLADEADKAAAAEASKHRETQSIGNALNTALDQRTAHQAELKRKQDDLDRLAAEKAAIEAKISADRKIAQIIEGRDAALRRAVDAADKRAIVQVDLRAAMTNAWRSLLADPIRRARQAAEAAMEARLQALERRLSEAAVKDKHCGVCDQDVAGEALTRLKGRLAQTPAPQEESGRFNFRDLPDFQDGGNSGEVRQLVRQLRALQIEEKTALDEAEDYEADLQGADPASVRSTQASYADVSERIAIVRLAMEGETRKIAGLDQNIDRLRQKLKNAHPGDMSGIEARAGLLRASAGAFEEAIGEYKAALRANVEASATTLFLAMTTETSDYAKLAINEEYGLTIVHQDGRVEEARSAGAEHVVALALMGALQNNAPLRGPIVMDSPFGRLDEKHTSNVVSALNKMAEQVILLVYESEVGRDRARQLLGSALLAEYELQRVSSRRTNIRKVQ